MVLKSLPHLQSKIALVDRPDDVTSKGDLQVSGDEVRTVGIVPGTILEQVLCDRLRIYDDDVSSQGSEVHDVS